MSKAEGNNSYEKYLEKNYDDSGNLIAKYKQRADDLFEAEQLNQQTQAHDERRKEEITERLLGKEAVTKEEIDELMGEYAGNETEYLVNGALLSCNRATRNPVKLTIDGQEHNFECPQLLSMDSTTLR